MAVGNPFLVVPQSRDLDNCLIADLGTTSVSNILFRRDTQDAPLITSIRVSVSSLRLSLLQSGNVQPIFQMPELPLEIFVPLPEDTDLFPTAVGKVSIPTMQVSLLASQIPSILSLVKEQFLQVLSAPDQGMTDRYFSLVFKRGHGRI